MENKQVKDQNSVLSLYNYWGYMFLSQISIHMSILYVYISIPPTMDSTRSLSMKKQKSFEQFFNFISQFYFMKFLIFHSKSYFTQVKTLLKVSNIHLYNNQKETKQEMS